MGELEGVPPERAPAVWPSAPPTFLVPGWLYDEAVARWGPDDPRLTNCVRAQED